MTASSPPSNNGKAEGSTDKDNTSLESPIGSDQIEADKTVDRNDPASVEQSTGVSEEISALAANLEKIGDTLIDVSEDLMGGIDKAKAAARLLDLVDANSQLQESISKFKSAFGIENKATQLTEKLQATSSWMSQAI